MTTPPLAILFDLDDTLYDHQYSTRQGLDALVQRHPVMKSVSIDVLEERFSTTLERTHSAMLAGELTQDAAREIRFCELFESFGISLTKHQALDEYRKYRTDYDQNCQVVRGSHELLRRLRKLDLHLAIITNNIVAEQKAKLRKLDLHQYFDVLAISEEVGVTKPEPLIYQVTLDRLGLQISDVVMVGNSLSTDIAGAVAIGMRSVWLQRRPELQEQAPDHVAVIERDFNNVEDSIRTILMC